MASSLLRLLVLVLLVPALVAPNGAAWAWCLCAHEDAATAPACCEHEGGERSATRCSPEECDTCDECAVVEVDPSEPMQPSGDCMPLDHDVACATRVVETVPAAVRSAEPLRARDGPIGGTKRFRSGVLTLRI